MLVMLVYALLAAETPVDVNDQAQQMRFFETSIRPLLTEHCFKCHGAKKEWGGLRVDSREALLRGGDSGPAVVSGDPKASLLVRVVRHEVDGLNMPKDSRLSDRQIADLARWVEMGVPFPKMPGADTRYRDPKHWTFQPVIAGAIPEVNNREWPQSALDRFILAKMESAGITPAGDADKRTLIRRVTFDLTGVPPTIEEIEAYLSDEAADAYARVVDRLLDSPSYGERWGRYWLDVARYADSNGLDENVAHGNAWRYRDYVVAALNADKPFNRFVQEQLAGDLLPFETEAQQHEQLIATGFLGIGPKVLAETDLAKMRMDIIDEQLDTTGRAFLGLTLGCARCHDHKFDPIDTADYYGLAGIFKSTRSMRKYTKLAEWHENALPSAAANAMQLAFNEKVATAKTAIESFVAAANKAVADKLATGAALPDSPETHYPDATKAELKKLRDALAALEAAGPNLPSAMGVAEDSIVDVAIHVRGNPLKLGEVVARRTPTVVSGVQNPKFTDQESGRRQLADWIIDPQHPLTSRVFVNRVWAWHFGRGIVRTTDNFGLLGEAPSHPELLDWLARQFVSDGWSLKALHRLILNSRTYRQSYLASSNTLAHDPENQLYSRAAVRRLEAEAIRDSLLAVSGQLDWTIGGSLLKLKNREFFFDHTSKDLTTYESCRRSLYLPVVRNNVFESFQLFDFADPAVSSSRRGSTVVAPQALMMMNSDFVMKSAQQCAEYAIKVGQTEETRLSLLYLQLYGREPTAAERDADLSLVKQLAHTIPDDGDAQSRMTSEWTALCQVLFASSEFIYVR